jgi:hypothetical protein
MVELFSSEGKLLGSQQWLCLMISEVTKIPEGALDGSALSDYIVFNKGKHQKQATCIA